MKDTGITYQEALKKAQELGIVETDPTLDVEGWDTASKLLILTNVLMNQEKTLDDIIVEGISCKIHFGYFRRLDRDRRDIRSSAGSSLCFKGFD